MEDFRLFDLAETIPGPATEALGELAAKLDVAIIAPIFERRAPGVYHNSAVVLDNAADCRALPQDAHPGRSGVLREILFHAGRSGFRGRVERPSAASACSSAGTNGFPKPPG